MTRDERELLLLALEAAYAGFAYYASIDASVDMLKAGKLDTPINCDGIEKNWHRWKAAAKKAVDYHQERCSHVAREG